MSRSDSVVTAYRYEFVSGIIALTVEVCSNRRYIPIAFPFALASSDRVTNKRGRGVNNPEAAWRLDEDNSWYGTAWRSRLLIREQPAIRIGGIVRVERETLARGSIRLVIMIRNFETVIAVVEGRAGIVSEVIACPPIRFDQRSPGHVGAIVDIERITHRTEAKIVGELYIVLVANFLVIKMTDRASAYRVFDCCVRGRMHGYTLVIGVMDTVGIDQNVLYSSIFVHVDGIAAERIFAELLQLDPLDR